MKTQSVMNRPTILLIVGPTAAGKTELSIKLAEAIGGEIISADSRLFYVGMDIGTAKPNAGDLARVPHHLIDIAKPDEVVNLALYRQKVKQLVDEIYARGNKPILVGGTGQYIRSITEGWDIPKQEPDDSLREVLQKWSEKIGVYELHKKLSLLDPEAAGRIDPRNLRRTIRALEVIFLSGKRFSEQRVKSESNYEVIQIGITRPREQLYERIDQRIEEMLKAGLVEEVAGLLRLGYTTALPSISAIGYKEICAYLQGEYDLETAIMLIKRNTRTYVRRQANWFKSDDKAIQWFEYHDNILSEIMEYLKRTGFIG